MKKNIAKLMAPMRWYSGASRARWVKMTRQQPFTAVICYHRVTAETGPALLNIERGLPVDVFERQIRFLMKHFDPVSPSEARTPGGTRPRFAITFDDGTEDNYSVAAPILSRLGVPAAFYIVRDFVGTDRRFWWEELSAMIRASTRPSADLHGAIDSVVAPQADSGTANTPLTLSDNPDRAAAHDEISARLRHNLPHRLISPALDRIADELGTARMTEGRDYPLMDLTQLRDLDRRGFEIGAHTATHCNLSRATDAEVVQEVAGATRALEADLGFDKPIKSFAYPYGIQDARTGPALAADTDVTIAFSTGPGIVPDITADAYNQPRLSLNRDHPVVWAHNIDQAANVRRAVAADADGRLPHQRPNIASA